MKGLYVGLAFVLAGCSSQQVSDANACAAGVQKALQDNPGQSVTVVVASIAACSAFIVDVSQGVVTVGTKPTATSPSAPKATMRLIKP